MTIKSEDLDILEEEAAAPEQIFFDERLGFERMVLSLAKNLCSNCGSADRIRVRMVVPSEAGGVLVVSNGVALCRTCDMARDSLPSERGEKDGTVVSVWMTQRLREKVDSNLQPKKSFRSWSALSRYLISKYVADERRFDDLEQYQDSGSETKVTIRADREIYSTFSAMLKRRGMTVTDALKGLYLMYASGAGAVVNGRQK